MNQQQLFTRIAQDHLGIRTLRTRKSDSLDFHDVSVWGVRAALKAAFDAGKQSRAVKTHGKAQKVHPRKGETCKCREPDCNVKLRFNGEEWEHVGPADRHIPNPPRQYSR